MELLLFFECQCCGVKFYDVQSAGARYGTRFSLVREPINLQDPLNWNVLNTAPATVTSHQTQRVMTFLIIWSNTIDALIAVYMQQEALSMVLVSVSVTVNIRYVY